VANLFVLLLVFCLQVSYGRKDTAFLRKTAKKKRKKKRAKIKNSSQRRIAQAKAKK